ncbi:hypothetical protein P691DRAFT_757691 [Macrolepiota fuliginosa MF-IS2]|uniref:Uncharacterized protein n=1 Tax=Macrolepiota fuliginosa MF-IS2 TaxID=1400762 RepID=A0A9P6C6M1_9AGAR|nr:hypothetical protein P691DRAFT_757691 [Macrolepiota fuliginosa MF-IS2]
MEKRQSFTPPWGGLHSFPGFTNSGWGPLRPTSLGGTSSSQGPIPKPSSSSPTGTPSSDQLLPNSATATTSITQTTNTPDPLESADLANPSVSAPHSTNLKLILPLTISALVVLILVLAILWCKVVRPRRRSRNQPTVYPFDAGTVERARLEDTMASQPQPREKFARVRGDMAGATKNGAIQINLEDPSAPATGSGHRSNNPSVESVTESRASVPGPNDHGEQLGGELLMTIVHRLAVVEAAVGPIGQARTATTMDDSQWEDRPPDYVSRVGELSGQANVHSTNGGTTVEHGNS